MPLHYLKLLNSKFSVSCRVHTNHKIWSHKSLVRGITFFPFLIVSWFSLLCTLHLQLTPSRMEGQSLIKLSQLAYLPSLATMIDLGDRQMTQVRLIMTNKNSIHFEWIIGEAVFLLLGISQEVCFLKALESYRGMTNNETVNLRNRRRKKKNRV